MAPLVPLGSERMGTWNSVRSVSAKLGSFVRRSRGREAWSSGTSLHGVEILADSSPQMPPRLWAGSDTDLTSQTDQGSWDGGHILCPSNQSAQELLEPFSFQPWESCGVAVRYKCRFVVGTSVWFPSLTYQDTLVFCRTITLISHRHSLTCFHAPHHPRRLCRLHHSRKLVHLRKMPTIHGLTRHILFI
jgi:hypothetical protein